MRELDDLFLALSRSRFRAKFHLRDRELRMLQEKGIDVIMQQARELLTTRLFPAQIANDGKQTPWRGHPAFVAQHATATCCRGCLAKWHGIPRGKMLDAQEIEHVLATLRRWLLNQPTGVATSVATTQQLGQLELFQDAP
jgi:hypothetical protein